MTGNLRKALPGERYALAAITRGHNGKHVSGFKTDLLEAFFPDLLRGFLEIGPE